MLSAAGYLSKSGILSHEYTYQQHVQELRVPQMVRWSHCGRASCIYSQRLRHPQQTDNQSPIACGLPFVF